jgi:hypothetical protein
MALLLRTLNRQTRRTIQQYGVPVTEEQRIEVATALLPHIQRARIQSHELGVQLLRAQARELRVVAPEVQPIRPYERQAVVTLLENATRVERTPRARSRVTVEGSTPRSRRPVIEPAAPKVAVEVLDPVTRRQSRVTIEVTPQNRKDPQVVKAITVKVAAAAERHAQMPSREATTDAVEAAPERPGAVIGWARIMTGDETCGFCAMLASRGPTFPSEHGAKFVSQRSKRFDIREPKLYHDDCDCEVVLVRQGEDWVGREQYEALEKIWKDNTKKTIGLGSLKAFTAALNQERADGNADRFYVARPDGESEDS